MLNQVDRSRAFDLNEVQGLTKEMVRSWLVKNGCSLNVKLNEWQKNDKGVVGNDLIDDNLETALFHMSVNLKESIQDILNRINPRMRSGLPSDAAMETHDHWLIGERCSDMSWIYRTRHSDGIKEIRDHGGYEHCENDLRHWPVDEYGNKVKYQTMTE